MTRAACLLALDTSTHCMSVALTHGGRTWQREGEGGALASQHLLPMIDAVLREAGVTPPQLDAVAYGCGPGAFTGLRTACATAQGLAFAWRKPVIGVSSLQALADEAASAGGAGPWLCALDARMGEVYWATYMPAPQGEFSLSALYLTKPQEVTAPAGHWAGCGNAWSAPELAPHLPTPPGGVHAALPTARWMLPAALAAWSRGQALDATRAEPLYVRNKVAQTTAERMAQGAAR
ncbi:MAG: tRNA (adenosine(37)-N6)-threonylcarbamoyltransferase complex dimerization subunit type 1 TsaB [Betaproteobacteria bacterium]|nr:tRNA (adenosine(37)-N6)-threonylcarbamoyltransferase complex dimerization subunit type 1 TsaB [Betaproteobacteria bacterium]